MLREDKENSSEFLDCAQSGTAEGCGEDFRQKILDYGGVPHERRYDSFDNCFNREISPG
jgi:hypothetical protein